MAFLDNIFSASNYSDTLSRLLGYPQQQQLGEFEGFPDSYQTYGTGGLLQPVFGKPEATTELSAQARQPQPQAAPPPPQAKVDGFSNFYDHLRSGSGPITSLIGAVTGRLPEIKPTDDIREFEYAKRQGFQGGLSDWVQHKRAIVEQHGLAPIYGKDDKGNTVILQLGNKGTIIQPALPGGVKISEGVEKIDLGDRWGLLERRSGQIIGFQPKNLQAAAAQTALGKEQGTAMADLESIDSKMPGLESTMLHLDDLSKKATYTLVGQAINTGVRQLGLGATEGGKARAAYEAVIGNQIIPMLRDTFGPQFTEKEGTRLQKTLGDPDLSPEEKQEVLRAFIEQKRRDVEALRIRTGGAPAAQTPAPQTPAAPAAKSVDPILEAKQAIARGAPREKVLERLKSMGINPSGL